MKTLLIILFTLFVSLIVFSQKNKTTVTQFDVSVPLISNPDRDVLDPDTGEYGYWFLPDGLNANFGVEIHKTKWIALGIHSGINWKQAQKLVAIPIYGSLKLSAEVSKKDETSLFLAGGYGRSYALGRGNLSGNYKKISLGLETNDEISLFIELAQHGLKYNQNTSVVSFSLGISFTSF